MSLMVREAGEGDVDALISMMGTLDDQHAAGRPEIFCGSSTRPRPREYVVGLLVPPDSTVLVAALDGRIVGYVLIRMRDVDRPLLVRRRIGEVDALFVAEPVRHRGVGKALMQAAEEWVRQAGGSAVELVVWEFNDAGRRFYETQGYTTDFRRMRRTLAPPGDP